MAKALPYKLYFNAVHGVWLMKWKDGKWRSKQVPKAHQEQLDAERWAAEWWPRRQLAVAEAVDLPPETMAGLALRWVRYLADKPGGIHEESSRADGWRRNWLEPYPLANVRLDRLKLADCVKWVEALQKTERAPYTLRNAVQRARTMLADARGHGWYEGENFFADDYLRRKHKGAHGLAGKDVIVHLELEHVKAILQHSGEGISPGRHARNCLTLVTGIRAGEVCALAWEHLDLDEGWVNVTRQLTRNKGTFRDPKKRSFRKLPIHPAALPALREWKANGWRQLVGREPTKQDAVFADERGRFCVGANARNLRDDLSRYDVPTLYEGKHPITFHALRRSCLTMMTNAGINEADIKQMAGHAKAGVTNRHYVAANYERLVEAIAKLPLKAAPKPEPVQPSNVVSLASRRKRTA